MYLFKLRGICVLIFLSVATGAYAQATRTWVSGVGDDANPCSRTAPCKTFAGAISKTAASGVINVLDPGGFGGVTITKSIMIESDGELAGVLVAGTNAIVINALSTDNVTLRGLEFKGVTGALNGVRLLAGNVSIEKCTFDGFTVGIDIEPSSVATVNVSDSIIRNNSSSGILIKPSLTGSATGSIDNVRMYRNAAGLRVEDRGKIAVRNSIASNNTNAGFNVVSSGAAAQLLIEHSSALFNGAGFNANGSQATLTLTSNVAGNNTGAAVTGAGGAQIVACSDNKQFNNGAVSTATTCPAGSTF